MKFLFEHKWSGQYRNVVFVPYKTNEVFTDRHQVEMVVRQNDFLKSIDRIILQVTNSTMPHQIQRQTITFQQWLYRASVGNRNVIQGVELREDKIVRILFFKQDRYDVEHIIRHLYEETIKTFGEPMTNLMLSKQDLDDVKLFHMAEMSHSQKLLSLTGNPQGPGESPDTSTRKSDKRVDLYFGSYLDVTKGEPSQTSELTQENKDQTIQSIQSTIQSLADRQTALETSLQDTINNTVDTKLAPVKKDLSEFKKESSDQLGQILDKLNGIETSQNTTIATTVRSIFCEYFPQQQQPTNNPPSAAAEERPPGGSQ